MAVQFYDLSHFASSQNSTVSVTSILLSSWVLIPFKCLFLLFSMKSCLPWTLIISQHLWVIPSYYLLSLTTTFLLSKCIQVNSSPLRASSISTCFSRLLSFAQSHQVPQICCSFCVEEWQGIKTWMLSSTLIFFSPWPPSVNKSLCSISWASVRSVLSFHLSCLIQVSSFIWIQLNCYITIWCLCLW